MPTLPKLILALLLLASTMVWPCSVPAAQAEGSEVAHLHPYPPPPPRRRRHRVPARRRRYVPPPPPRYAPAPYRRAPRSRAPLRQRPFFYVGIGGGPSFVLQREGVSDLLRTGGGFNLFFGLRFSRYAALEAGLQVSSHEVDRVTFRSERGVFQSLSIDGKFFLSPRSLRVEPFLQAGMGFYGFYNTTFQSNRLKGFGLQLGGGVDIRLNRSIVLGGRLLYKAIFVDNFDDAYFGVPPESEVFNLFVPEINLQFHF